MSTEENTSLKSKTVKGILWGGMSNGVQQLIAAIFGIYLSRQLTAEDYGLVGLLTLFSVITSSLQEAGFISALANKKEVSQGDYNAVFWTTVFMGLSFYVVLFFVAPLISDFYQIPELTMLSRVLFLSSVCGSFGIVHSAYLFRNLKVKERATATTISVLISGVVAVVCVYFGLAYWAIVAQTITYSFCFSLMCFLFSNFRPSFHIDLSPIRELWQFSGKVLATTVANHVNNYIFTMFLGKTADQISAGYYIQANKWSTMAQGVVANMSHGFAQPMLSNLGDDQERQTRVFLKLLNFICFAVFPAMSLLCIIAEEFILITISSTWLESVPFLKVLCLNAAFLPIINFYSNFLLSKGASHIYMRYIISFGVLQVCLIFALQAMETLYIVWGISLLTMIWSFLWQIAITHYAKIKYIDLTKIVCRYMFLALLCGFLSFHLGEQFSNIYLSCMLKTITFASLYLGILYFTKSAILLDIVGYIGTRIKR